MAAAGMLDKQIAVELGLSPNTLRTYWTRIRGKVGELPRAALVADFVRTELHREGDDSAPLNHEGWILDVPTMMMSASDSINDLHGLERGKEHPVAHYSRLYHPEDRDATRAALYDVIEGRVDSAHLVFRLALETGVELVNLTVHSVRNEEGAVSKVYGYRARTLDCRVDRDPSVRIGRWERLYPQQQMWLDDELAAIVGREHGGVVEFSLVGDHFDTEVLREMEQEVSRAIETGVEVLHRDARFRHADGSVHWCRTTRTIVKQEDGQIRIYGTLAIFR
jgi:PAS domain-containing protein